MPPVLRWGFRPVTEVPAVITGPLLVTRTTTTLTVNITVDMPAQAWMEYGTTPSLGNATSIETQYLTSHTQVISGLSAGTTYHVRAQVINQAGIQTTSSIVLFATLNSQSGTTLQALIDAASPGGTVDCTGLSFTAGATINKALTLLNGTVSVSFGMALIVAADSVTIDGTSLSGAGHSTFSNSVRGISVNGTAADRISGLVIRDTTVSNFPGHGMYIRYASGALITGNTVEDISYTGIFMLSDLNSTVSNNTIVRIGNVWGLIDPNRNAYGIATTKLDGAAEVRSTGTIITGNTIGINGEVASGVPTWHALDTHGGIDHEWTNNQVYGSNRGIFLTSDSNNTAAQQVVSGNYFAQPAHGGVPEFGNYPYNMQAMFTVSGVNPTGSGNTVDGWPVATNGNWAGVTGTTIINPRAPGWVAPG